MLETQPLSRLPGLFGTFTPVFESMIETFCGSDLVSVCRYFHLTREYKHNWEESTEFPQLTDGTGGTLSEVDLCTRSEWR